MILFMVMGVMLNSRNEVLENVSYEKMEISGSRPYLAELQSAAFFEPVSPLLDPLLMEYFRQGSDTNSHWSRQGSTTIPQCTSTGHVHNNRL